MATIKVKPVDENSEQRSETLIRSLEDGIIKKTLGNKRRPHPEIDLDL